MSLAPRRMIPPHSWPVPGRKPGTSTNVKIGMLNASQVRTNRAAFSLASMSRQPARCIGWLATTPAGAPPEPDHDVLREPFVDLAEAVLVEHGLDDPVDVVGLVGGVGDQGVEFLI